MEEWRKHFKVISCACGRFLIIDLKTCDSSIGEKRFGHINFKEDAERKAQEAYVEEVLEEVVLR